MIVIDASVAAKWFLPEADSTRAAALLESGQKMLAPELIRVEVASAFARRVRLGELLPQHARAASAAWQQALRLGVLTVSPNEQDLGAAMELAITLLHPLQDCLYLACAQRLACPLVSADVKFTAKALTIYPDIRTL